jgi:N-acetylmuramoyl-L-alanine amidase
MKYQIVAALITAACIMPAAPAFAKAPASAKAAVGRPPGRPAAEGARDMYDRAMAQERALRDEGSKPTVVQMRRVVSSYESLVRRHPTSAYCDNALWQAANLAALAYERFGSEADRHTAVRLFTALTKEYPASKLGPRAAEALHDLASAPTAAPLATTPARLTPASDLALPPVADPAAPPRKSKPGTGAGPEGPAQGPMLLKAIHRSVLPDGIRLIVDLEAEVAYHQEEITNPRRLFFDLRGVKAAPGLQDVSLKFGEDIVKEVRLGRHPQNTTRLVVDLEGVSSYSVYPLFAPYRLVIDFRRAVAATPPPATRSIMAPVVPPIAVPPPLPTDARNTSVLAAIPQVRATVPEPKPPLPQPALLPSEPAGPKSLPPVAPSANLNGKFSLSRQLGLSVSRVVIDAGHGGHDPGAHGNGIDESELTLDVALRVQKLLQKQPGVEVVMTRDSDVFIPLEERTAIANREGADLFLSIHANASRNAQARGIETYFLNFAMNPEAEAVAARENATSGRAMHSLPDIVRTIALNNKINESRELAETVQRSMAKKLAAKNRALRDLGVKQAPFVVLIGAVMPSVLAEISFVTNKQDGALLKTQAYRQQIAQALFDAILNYQQSLKRMNAVAGKKATSQ